MSHFDTQARYPGVALGKGHYESYYLRACHPSEPLGVWIRYTIHKRPGAQPTGSLWVTLFDGAIPAPLACKVTRPFSELAEGGDDYLRIGDSHFGAQRISGEASDERCHARWDLTLDSGEPALRHLPNERIYKTPLPRTKLLSPHPAARFSGTFELHGRTIDLDGWPGMVGHNWGAEHAERWIWMHGVGFEGQPNSSWLDVAVGRIKLGPLTTPWITNGALSIGGVRHALGGPARVRSTRIEETPSHCQLTLAGKGIEVSGSVGADLGAFVGWVYADPGGSEHHSVNCSVAEMKLTVKREGLAPLELRSAHGAVYELGMREHDHGVPIQPFPDG